MSNWFSQIVTSIRLLNRKSMSPVTRNILEREETKGARATNVFRYLIGFLFLFSILFSAQNASELYVNGATLGIYFCITMVHTFLLRRKSERVWGIFNYATIVLDFGLIGGLTIYYALRYNPDNFAHAIKSPTLFYLFIPLAMSILQYRARLVFVALLMFILFWFGMLFYGTSSGMPITENWKEYILGPAVIMSDAYTRVIPFIAVAAILSFGTFRAVNLVRRVGEAEGRRASLARFFSPDVVEELSSEDNPLGQGVRQTVTILFSDIRNFTKMSEGMDPQELADFLTEFRDRMTNSIFLNGGTIDKFVGDAIMATFGTPRPSKIEGLDARNAVSAGIAMMQALKTLNTKRQSTGLPGVEIGIGIHCGEVFCGTIGTEGRMEYTVIGDAVNTASRIESMCKFLKTDFLISDSVNAQLGSVQTQRMPLVKVKGKEHPLQVFRVYH